MPRRVWVALCALFSAIVVAFKEEILGRRKKRVVFDETPTVLPIKTRKWVVPFEVSGQKGEVQYAWGHPQCFFRGERLVAVDDSIVPGHGTVVERIEVKMRPQMTPVPYCGPIPTYAFGEGSVAAQTKYETCYPAGAILYQIRFLETCTWYGVLFGSALV